MAAEPKLTPERHKTIIAMVRAQRTLVDAARKARIGRWTPHRWRERGEAWLREHGDEAPPESEAPYVAFALDLGEAQADRNGALIATICSATQGAGNPDWRAAAYWLEKLDPTVHGRGKQLERRKLRAEVQKLEREAEQSDDTGEVHLYFEPPPAEDEVSVAAEPQAVGDLPRD